MWSWADQRFKIFKLGERALLFSFVKTKVQIGLFTFIQTIAFPSHIVEMPKQIIFFSKDIIKIIFWITMTFVYRLGYKGQRWGSFYDKQVGLFVYKEINLI